MAPLWPTPFIRPASTPEKILSGDKAADLPVIEVRDQPQDRQGAWLLRLHMSPIGPSRPKGDVRSYVSSWRQTGRDMFSLQLVDFAE
jgi:hypothetical protein